MDKSAKRVLSVLAVIVFVCGLSVLYYGRMGQQYPQEAIMIETEILDISISDTNKEASLRVSKEGGFDQIMLQEDTALKDEKGKQLNFSDLEPGQSIAAVVNPTVLYDAIVQEPDLGITDSSVNIFWRCYEVTVLE